MNAVVEVYPLLIAGKPDASGTVVDVVSPFDGSLVGRTYQADAAIVEQAASAVIGATGAMKRLRAYERAEILSKIAVGLQGQREHIAHLIAREAGKPIRDARVEVDRAVLTMQTSAAEATRIYGEVIPLDVIPAAADRIGMTRRFPIGPILAITPFNFPLNLVCHKLGPAIAAGNPILIKPAPKTPLTALALGQIAFDAGLPPEALGIVHCDNLITQTLVEDARFKVLSFTGSDTVGWMLKSLAGKKKVLLELGGNAGVIIDHGADLDLALQRVVAGGFGYAGQSCISVQRVLVHEAHYDEFVERLSKMVCALQVGDPLDEATDVGPLINEDAVRRVSDWVAGAVSWGATVICGGNTAGSCFQPTILVDVNADSVVCTNEAFAPLVILSRFGDFNEAVSQLNASRYGLQAGVFTPNLAHAMQAFEQLEVGGVIVNDVPTFRADPMPYGGVKYSGLGREGVRYAIEEFTELRLLVLRTGSG